MNEKGENTAAWRKRKEKKQKQNTQYNHHVTKDIYLFGEPEYKQK